jgi:hypothetical protein
LVLEVIEESSAVEGVADINILHALLYELETSRDHNPLHLRAQEAAIFMWRSKHYSTASHASFPSRIN